MAVTLHVPSPRPALVPDSSGGEEDENWPPWSRPQNPEVPQSSSAALALLLPVCLWADCVTGGSRVAQPLDGKTRHGLLKGCVVLGPCLLHMGICLVTISPLLTLLRNHGPARSPASGTGSEGRAWNPRLRGHSGSHPGCLISVVGGSSGTTGAPLA